MSPNRERRKAKPVALKSTPVVVSELVPVYEVDREVVAGER